tara:strand:- start:506 stop:1915 length:1410 start_codon:yes stop_codon:yes gene_type:complete
MINKIKVKPKVWSKEYTFEEYKRLNPNINENELINYYNRSYRVFLEDRSKHMKHFDDRKTKLSNEIRTLKYKKQWDWDNHQNNKAVGESGPFRSPLNANTSSVAFDRVDDVIPLNFIQEGRIPNDGTLKPYKGLTVAVWVNFNNFLSTSAHSTTPFTTGTTYDIVSCGDSQSGWALYYANYRLNFLCFHTLTSSSPLIVYTSSTYKAFHDYITDQPGSSGALGGNKQQFRDDGWHYIVATWDGRDQTLWVDGIPSYATGLTNNPTNNNTGYNWNVSTGGGHPFASGFGHADSGSVGGLSGADILAGASSTVSGSLGSIYYSNQGTGYLSNNHLNNVSIGARPDTHANGSFLQHSNFWTGSIAEVAIWDEGLDATTINELWHNGISGSAPKFDLSYPGYNNGALDHNHPYDLIYDGLSYKNVGNYAESLQGWWRLEEGTGIVAKDSSGKDRDGELVNSPTWSGSYAPGPY